MALTRLPRQVDDLPYILIWRADDFVPPVVFLAFGILIGHPFLLLAVGLAAGSLYRRYRDGRPELYPLHLLYWSGIYPARGRSFRTPFLRRFEP